MRKLLFLMVAFLAFANGKAQILDPVKWKTRVEKISDTELNLVFEAKIEEGWHMYSQFTSADGSLPLEIKYKNEKGNYERIGKTTESKTKKAFNDVFGVEETFFENNATLTQKIKITNSELKKIEASIDGQACIDGKCIQLSKALAFDLPKTVVEAASPSNISIGTVDSSAVVKTTIKDSVKEVVPATVATTSQPKEAQKGLWAIFILSFLGGFAALLTPCVFPMIPMTVSFFTKQSKTKSQGKRNAILYGISIIIIYVVLGLLITAIFGADALSDLSTNEWFNLIFFLLLVLFAVSFLGAFEIVLPNSWANKIDRQADRGGFIGILFMALALAIVSFSCTGPIVGTLLVESASKGGIAPAIGMLGFSLAIALPFMLFALFPSWLNSLPKSGGWLNTVKVSLGFLELAFAFKFLSNADLVLQWHLLERELFLAIWIAIFGTWGIYLLGKIKLPHDDSSNVISVGRLFVALLVLSFSIYLVPGLFGAPLKLISAFPPPQKYSESPSGFYNNTKHESKSLLPKGANYGPNNIVSFEDYEIGLAYAKKINKPILIDFTGHACANCRLMESNVWSDDKVLSILKNDVVLISLFCDERTLLSAKDQYISKETKELITTIGQKWSEFERLRYKTNARPYYVLLNTEEKPLNTPVAYTPNISQYKAWLKDGISKFKK
jgi:thiol:disulfide interchange protein